MASSIRDIIVKEFRQDLESFFRRVHLAPPYDSVEKALACLCELIRTKTDEEQQQVLNDHSLKGKLYQKAVIESGLHRKHRGIISGILRTQPSKDLPEIQKFLQEPWLN